METLRNLSVKKKKIKSLIIWWKLKKNLDYYSTRRRIFGRRFSPVAKHKFSPISTFAIKNRQFYSNLLAEDQRGVNAEIKSRFGRRILWSRNLPFSLSFCSVLL